MVFKLANQSNLPDLPELICLDTAEINTAAFSFGSPDCGFESSTFHTINQGFHQSPTHIIQGNINPAFVGQFVADFGDRIERVGVVLREPEG